LIVVYSGIYFRLGLTGKNTMKKLSRTKKILLIAIISTLILFLFEGILGAGIGLIPLGSGGDMDVKLTLGGFIHETYYPLTLNFLGWVR
jgi:hypothetical protein